MYILCNFNIDTTSALINQNIGINDFQNMFLSYCYTTLIDNFIRVDKGIEKRTHH